MAATGTLALCIILPTFGGGRAIPGVEGYNLKVSSVPQASVCLVHDNIYSSTQQLRKVNLISRQKFRVCKQVRIVQYVNTAVFVTVRTCFVMNVILVTLPRVNDQLFYSIDSSLLGRCSWRVHFFLATPQTS